MNFIYHLYPLGVLDVPHRNHDPVNDTTAAVAGDVPPIRKLVDWIPYVRDLGCDGVLLGPVFQSESHGYDIVDPYRVDTRLGGNEDLAAVCGAFREAGISVLLDAVFNHVGRSHFAFQDLLRRGQSSDYNDWFHNIDFSREGRNGDPFTYETWDGHDSLVKLNLEHPDVISYLLDAVKMWRERFQFGGLRLDAADVITPTFWPKLREVVGDETLLIGEMVHGDYSSITGAGMVDGVTNYECYKGLYSSLNDGNLFEIAWSLNRQFGPEGIYRGLPLQSFVDNHDVDRIASTVNDDHYLYPIHLLLFTMPGIPSVYYGSEAGLPGVKGIDDWPLRPPLAPNALSGPDAPHPDLRTMIRDAAALRRSSEALRRGDYRQIYVSNGQIVFLRESADERILVAINGEEGNADIPVAMFELPDEASDRTGLTGVDLLNGHRDLDSLHSLEIPGYWGRVIRLHR